MPASPDAADLRALQGRPRPPGIAFMPEPDGLHSTRWLTALTIDPAESASRAKTSA